MHTIHYEEATGSELMALRPYERRRIFDEVDEQLTIEPSIPSRRRKKLFGVKPPWELRAVDLDRAAQGS